MMAKKLKKEWNQMQDITTYFRYIEDTATKLDMWDIDCSEADMVRAAVDQMIGSGIFECTFLRNREKKPLRPLTRPLSMLCGDRKKKR